MSAKGELDLSPEKGVGRFPEALQLFHERRAFQVEELRRAAFISAGALERPLDELALDMRDERIEVETVLGERDGGGKRRLMRLLNFHREIGDVNLRPSRADRNRA